MRLFLKTMSYGAVHIVVATAVAYLIIGNFAMALGIGLIEPIVQTGVFALHEHFWERDKSTADEEAPNLILHSCLSH